ncbi:MAG: TonB-dependent receptor [Bacteroidetes bacterium]|jgi:hypothetical protein|nr:TonB-dependent receptor [Bacteroidota bacterium]
MKRLATIGCALALFALLPLNHVFAQGTTASLTGQVVDENGEPLPGANVVAVHQPTGTQYGTATNPNGRYTILNMRVGGPYAIRASFVGYQSIEETGIVLELDEKRTLDFTLQPRTAEMEAVEVVARRNTVISKNRTGAATNVSEDQIDELPTIGRSITDFSRLVPQAGGSGSLAGANDRYNSIQIDGATLDDVFGLGDAVPGSQAGAQPISLDAIQEFNVNIAPYDVRSGGFTGGQINAITKSGSNEFSGSFRFKGGTENFTGDNPEGIGTSDFNQAFYVGTLGGPIIEDELFFFVAGELKRESSPLDTRIGTDLDGTNVFDESVETLQEIRSILQDVYNYQPGGLDPITQRQDDEKLLVKLDWNINANHRLTLRNNYVNATDDSGISRGENTFSFANRQYVFRSRQNSATAQLNSTFSDNMFNEARLVYTRIRDQRDVLDSAFPETVISLGSENEAVGGIDRFSQANRLDQDLFEFTNDFTYVRGNHTLTIGTSNKLYQFTNLFIQDYFGSYTFEAFETPGGEEISATEALRRGQPTEYLYSYATSAAGMNRPEADFLAFQLGGYVQDEWQVSDDLRLTLGLRVDVPVLPDEPTFNRTAFEAFGRSTSDVASGNPLWSPRFGFNYDRDLFGEDLSTQVRGGAGIFSGDPPYVWISNQYSNTGADLNRIDANFDPADAFYGDGAPAGGFRFMPTSAGEQPTAQPCPVGSETCDESQYSALLSPIETTEINLIADGFKYPQTLRANLGIDQELPLGFIGTLEGIYSKTVNDVSFRNINIEAPTSEQYAIQTSKYGRPFYGTPGAGFGGSTNRVSERFTNALLLDNTNDGYQYSLTAQLQRRVDEGLSGSVSYTYNRAENVNNGTSSRAISNWQFNENKDINDPRIGTADFEIRHRLLGTLNYRISYAERLATTVGLVFESRAGEPFSWIYFGNANGDTQSFNDLVYVPETASDIVLESDNWELMDAFIDGNEALDEARGTVISRNTARAPWQNLLDLRLAQSIGTFQGQNVQVTLDVENVLNLLNDDWGRIQRTSFNNITAWNFEGYVTPDDVGTAVGDRILTEDDIGKPRVTFEEETVRDQLSDRLFNTSDIFSRWRMRLGVKYTF